MAELIDGGHRVVSGVDDAKAQLRVMATPEFTRDMSAQVRSRRPLIHLISSEEKRIIEYYRQFAIAAGYRTFVWDCYNGLLNISTLSPASLSTGDPNDVESILDWIVKEATTTHESESMPVDNQFRGNLYLLLDFHRFLNPCEPGIERRLRTLARMNCRTTVILVSPVLESTPALEKDIAVLDFPFPNDNEIRLALKNVTDSVVDSNSLSITEGKALQTDTANREDEIVRSVGGLTMVEVDAAFSKSVVMHRRFDIPTIIKEKQQIIRKTKVLEYVTPEVGIEDVGGLGNMIGWLKKHKKGFETGAKEFGLPTPKGILIFGIPGTGKSLSAKACAKEYGMPLLRLDFGSLFSQYVGESERTARNAIKIAEAVAPCVLWCDEIEKGVSGMRSSGATDSGTTSRVVSTFLTWMQEKKAPVFVIATANNAEQIPPEFMRAGRFDEVFFCDLPNRIERGEILRAIIRRKKREQIPFDITALVSSCDGYTGAEIEKAIDLALFDCYDSGRDLTTNDILNAFPRFQPISKMQKETVRRLQEWAFERCVKANSPEVSTGTLGVKQIDLGTL